MNLFRRRKRATSSGASVRVLLVCMGNICRSPMAEGLLRQRLAVLDLQVPVEVDSAGTHGYHDGAPPDPRARAAALRRGVDISRLRARQVVQADFEHFDLVLAMDEDNHAALVAMAGVEHHPKIRLLLEFAGTGQAESTGTGTGDARQLNVPDPYYGGALGFERVLDLVEEAMAGLLDEVERMGALRLTESRSRNPAG